LVYFTLIKAEIQMKKIRYIAVSVIALAITSCTKNVITATSTPAVGAQFKFFHAAPGVPALDAFINGTQVTPVGSVSVTDNLAPTSIVTGFTYLNVFPGSNYSVSASGNTTIKIATSTPVPALISPQTLAPAATLKTFTQTTADGEAYSLITSGLPGSATTPLTTFLIKDVFPAAVSGKAYVRLAHMIPNGGAVDLTGTYTPTGGVATTVTVLTNKTYGTVTDFVPVDVNTLSTTAYAFQAVLTGTTTKLGTSTVTTGSTTVVTMPLTPGRYYTIVLRGLATDYAVPGTSIVLKATARPTLPTTDPTTRFPEIYFNVPGLTYYTNK
jgi:hypothetical protein